MYEVACKICVLGSTYKCTVYAEILAKITSEKFATFGRVTHAINEIKIGEIFVAIQSMSHWRNFSLVKISACSADPKYQNCLFPLLPPFGPSYYLSM